MPCKMDSTKFARSFRTKPNHAFNLFVRSYISAVEFRPDSDLLWTNRKIGNQEIAVKWALGVVSAQEWRDRTLVAYKQLDVY